MAKNTRIIFFVVCDLVCFSASYLLACLLAQIDFTHTFMILAGIKLLAMFVFSVYKIMFEFAAARDYQRVALSLVASTLAAVTAAAIIKFDPALNTRVIVFSLIFDMALGLAVRLLYVRMTEIRIEEEDEDENNQSLRHKYTPQRRERTGRVMVIGNGKEAADLISEMQEESTGRKPEIIIDDDGTHKGDSMHGIEMVSGRTEIRLRARRMGIDEIIIAKPAASKRQLAALLRECVKTRCKISMLPLVRMSDAERAVTQMRLADLRKPTISDLLARERPRVDHREIGDQLRGRVVLVTGGAGVFGSELCRRIIRYRPRRLIALDIDEDGLAMLDAEFESFSSAETEFRPILASVRDQAVMERIFSAFRPHLVFHAAELKQTPFAQIYPREWFLTNVLGLKTTSDLAEKYSAEKFILCSTVRAAVPTNVATECKRAAELYVSEKNMRSQTAYTTVRFPNLIEGRGNVIAIFTKQLEQGGPLTLTDKDIVRRFIGAEEAAVLTVFAAARASGGEVLEIGPGEAIGIRDLAEAMIRLSGKIPYEDIDIIVTELRPGEQLFEELEMKDTRGAAASASGERIWLVEDKSGAKLPRGYQLWGQDPYQMDDAAVMELLRLIFPTYKIKPPGTVIRGEKIDDEQQ